MVTERCHLNYFVFKNNKIKILRSSFMTSIFANSHKKTIKCLHSVKVKSVFHGFKLILRVFINVANQ